MTGTTTTADAPRGETGGEPEDDHDGTLGPDDGDTAPAQPTDPTSEDAIGPPYRLRDLDRRGRIWAAVLAAALLLAPVQAFARVVSDWMPASDPALIGIQSLAVGSAETPLIGQPSTSGHYVGTEHHVSHLGPLHDYLLAVPMRVLVLHVGMLSVSLLITGSCILIMAWATYRRLGPLGGSVGVGAIGLLTFTTGASSLMAPVSSNLAGYPLYCSAVLVWCLLRGDLRLLPLTAGIVTFAAQLHLSVLPTVAVLVAGGVAGLLYQWGRRGRWRDAGARRELLAWSALSGAVALVLWSPMLIQQLTGNPGNLSSLARLSVDDSRPTVGLGSAVRQVAHALGWPPLLGNLHLTGWKMITQVDMVTWITAALVLVILAGLGLRWRRSAPEQQSVVVMVGVLVVAGLVNGSSLLEGAELSRLVMYHWAFPLAFFALLGLALGAIEGGRALAAALARRRQDAAEAGAGDGDGDKAPRRRRLSPRWAARTRPALASLVLLVVTVPALVNPTLERRSNNLSSFYSPLERRYIENLMDQVLAHRDQFDEPLRLIVAGHNTYNTLEPTLGLYLLDAGVDVRLSREARQAVPDKWLVGPDHGSGALLLVQDDEPNWEEVTEGQLIADVMTDEDFDVTAYDTAVRAFTEAEEIRFGPTMRDMLDELGVPETWVDAAERGELASSGVHERDIERQEPTEEQIWGLGYLLGLDELSHDPGTQLTDQNLLNLLQEYPLEAPALDAELLQDLEDSRENLDQQAPGRPLRLRAYLLDADDQRRLDEENDENRDEGDEGS